MNLAAFFLLAGALHFNITDARGKKAPGAVIEQSAQASDGWYQLKLVKAKPGVLLVWPFDGEAKAADGPEPIPALVLDRGDRKSLASPHLTAALATPVLLGLVSLEGRAQATGFDAATLDAAFTKLADSEDPWEKGVGLLYKKDSSAAAEQLKEALRQRQRQLTRVPSEIYAAAMLYGTALAASRQFDDAAVAFRTALLQRPADEWAQTARAEAPIKAGKLEAAK